MTRTLVYYLVDMTTMPLSEAKAQLPRLLRETEELGERFVITRSGRPAAVLLSNEEYEGLLETLEILADPKLAASVRKGLADAGAGRLLGHQELWGGVDRPLRR